MNSCVWEILLIHNRDERTTSTRVHFIRMLGIFLYQFFYI